MALDPEQSSIIATLAEGADENAPPLLQIPPEAIREAFKPMIAFQGPPEDAQVSERLVPTSTGDITLRVYAPQTGAVANGPGVFFIHGGGWVINDLDSYEPMCRKIANALGAVVTSVGYRKAPEHKFPGPVNDCWAALNYVVENAESLTIDPNRLALMGDSAGGNLCAAMTLKAKETGHPKIAAQVLHVPVTDHNFDTGSYARNGEGYVLTKEFMQWFWSHYLETAADGDNPLASPLRATDLSGLPPALVQTCEYDPLLDEGAAYAERLKSAGVDVTYTEISGTAHDPYFFYAALPKGTIALDEAITFLQEKLD